MDNIDESSSSADEKELTPIIEEVEVVPERLKLNWKQVMKNWAAIIGIAASIGGGSQILGELFPNNKLFSRPDMYGEVLMHSILRADPTTFKNYVGFEAMASLAPFLGYNFAGNNLGHFMHGNAQDVDFNDQVRGLSDEFNADTLNGYIQSLINRMGGHSIANFEETNEGYVMDFVLMAENNDWHYALGRFGLNIDINNISLASQDSGMIRVFLDYSGLTFWDEYDWLIGDDREVGHVQIFIGRYIPGNPDFKITIRDDIGRSLNRFGAKPFFLSANFNQPGKLHFDVHPKDLPDFMYDFVSRNLEN